MGYSAIRVVASKAVSTPVVLIDCVGPTPTLPTDSVQIGSLTEIVVKTCAGLNSHITHCKGLEVVISAVGSFSCVNSRGYRPTADF